VRKLWDRLAAGEPLAEELVGYAEEAGMVEVAGPRVPLAVGAEADLRAAESRLYADLGTAADTGMDRLLHRRCSLPITRGLARTALTPNQVSLASLAAGVGAIACVWRGTPGSALAGLLLYALASIVDHCDGELARLTFQESPLGARLDWTIDTLIHGGLVLAMAVGGTGGPMAVVLGLAGALGVVLCALLAARLPRGAAGASRLGGALARMGNRDLFYLVLVAFVFLRSAQPRALPALAVLVAVGSQAYWIACALRIRRASAMGPPG